MLRTRSRRRRRSGRQAAPAHGAGQAGARRPAGRADRASASASRTAPGASSSTASRARWRRRKGLEEMSGGRPRAWVVFDFEVPRAELLRRLSGRRWCPSCQATYHLTNNPPKRAGRLRRVRHEPRPARGRQRDGGGPAAAASTTSAPFPLIEYYRDAGADDPASTGTGRWTWSSTELRRARGGAGVSVQKSWSELQTMARACRIVVDTLDALEAAAVPGVDHEGARPHRPGAHREGGGPPGVPRLPRLSRRRCASRSTRRSSTASRAPRKLREGDIVGLDLGLHRGRLLRRRGAHGGGGAGERRRRSA